MPTIAVGVELDARLIRVAAARDVQRAAHFVQGDARRLPFADGTFGLAILYDVLEHVRAWQEVVRETARVLKPGGGAYVTAANVLSPITILDDPHWHVPLLAILPRSWSEWLVRSLDPVGLQMSGEHPAFPSWSELLTAFRSAGLDYELVSVADRIQTPESIVSERRRTLARALRSRVYHMRGSLGSQLLAAYDRFAARSWTFLLTKRARS